MQTLQIIVSTILACICYGIVHDQITARICVEYFTVGHLPIFNTTDPTVLGVGWGILATWWVGLLLGTSLAVSARVGPRSKRSAVSLIGIVLLVASITALAAALAGLAAAVATSNGWIELPAATAARLPPHARSPFLIDLWIHNTSYIVGFLSGLVAIAWVWWTRITMARASST